MDEFYNPDATFQRRNPLSVVGNILEKPNLVALVIGTLVLYPLSVIVYRLRFHPLSKYPGPVLAAISIKQYEYHYVKGDITRWMKTLHDKYGEIVRIGPNQLDYSSPQAWKDIYGHKTATRHSNPKNRTFVQPSMDGHESMHSIDDDSLHGRQRKIFSHAFSDRALLEQHDIIENYIDQLIALIRKRIEHNEKAQVDMVQLYNWTSFDIIGDLTFGQSLDNLSSGKNSPWIDVVFTNFKAMVIGQCLAHYRILSWLMWMLTPKKVLEEAATHARNSRDRVTERLEIGKKTDRPDIWGLVLKHEGDDRMPRGQMNANSFLFMLAGSETTATLLSGATWLLLKNPDKYNKLTKEIRAVERESDLDPKKLRQMKYLVAALEEALRWYPPVPLGTERRIPKGGNLIMGDVLPENTVMSVSSWSTSHSASNFLDPEEYIPERWIFEETDYKKYHDFDKREAVQPFSIGPRNCLGKNLAYYEMRSIMARVLYNFDLELCSESENWGINQKNWSLWEKPELKVWISERR
ncbi:cytochrome P450 [Corynespora cassiicola Philippines]|uniref:Cytochrome P450 n=1 Tax=Corynespora cassiicola Philippines TaxID=1448308 RepID=A0A2T2NX33_CORCC|nr:cytochrome P450 [Corynespora cassiicola Philippines]